VALPLFLFSTLFFEFPELSLAQRQEFLGRIAGTQGFWLLTSMIASYGLGDLFFFWSTRALGVPGALALASSYPLWSAAAGFFFFGQSLSILKILGVASTVAGTVVVILVGYHHRKREVESWIERFPVGVLFGALTSIFWAINAFAVARGTEGLAPHFANSVRMVIAVGLCPVIGFFLFRQWRFGISWRRFVPVSWVFVLESYGGSFFFVYGFAHAPIAVASALSSLAPVIAVPVAWWSKHEAVSFWKAAGVALAVFGAILLVLPG
jgi:drug/metabolite transporter (DMT)-like permease